jgi:polyphosphate kinase
MAEPQATFPHDPPADPEALEARPIENLEAPQLYFNRELSWLKFNERVLEEALDRANPLLERILFLSIFYSNLDEFFMVRVSGLRRQMLAGVLEAPPDGMTPTEQLAAIRSEVIPALETALDCWQNDLSPRLEEVGIHLLTYDALKGKQRKLLRRHFKREIFPVLTPLAFDPGHPFPHISNLSINLAVVVRDPEDGERFARLKVPASFPRLVRIPEEQNADAYEELGLSEVKSANFIWLEDVVAENLDLLFPGLEVVASFPFRVTRDADLELEEDEAADLLQTVAEVVGQRHFGSAVRLEIEGRMPKLVSDILTGNLRLAPYQVFTSEGPIGLSDLSQLASIDRPDLKFPPFQPTVHSGFQYEEDLFTVLRRRDVLLFHPYDSFTPMVQLLQQAANDPRVLAIKQTLYRVGSNSPIVQALMEARQNGKQVSVLVELKARFDEENNIVWARALEQAGVHVVYGVVGLKTHAKICMVVRAEKEGIRRYLHFATGNYNPVTARIYTDLGLFTTDDDLAADVSDLFNSLTGYSRKESYRKLLVAPGAMREGIVERIEREIDRHRAHGDGYIAFKMNALVDKRCIQALYRASQAGVEIDLLVRGICCLRPGIPGVSATISVTSIVGRFLEHTRFFYFRNGGNEDLLMGSADLMPRNLDGRVEVLVPIEAPHLIAAIREDILAIHLADNVHLRELHPDGSYHRRPPADGEAPLDSQSYLLANGGKWAADE